MCGCTHLALVLAGSDVDTVGVFIAVVVVSASAEIGGSTTVRERVVGVTDPLGLTLSAVEATLHVTRVIHVIFTYFRCTCTLLHTCTCTLDKFCMHAC